jgi:outer membrane immunogenic protein
VFGFYEGTEAGVLCAQVDCAEGIPVYNESRCVAVVAPLAAVSVLALAGALTVGSAQAADLIGRPGSLKDFPIEPAAPRCAIFHGFYLGGHLGGASQDWTWQDRDDWTGEVDGDLHNFASGTDSGLAGGVQAGFNWQRGCTVLGFEADWSWADLDSSKLFSDGDAPPPDTDTLRVRSNIDGFGTLRTRAGVVVDNLLLYATGGLAFADIERRATLHDESLAQDETFTFSDTRLGLAAGVGTEWAITDFISLKSEALWLRFEEDSGSRICALAVCERNEPKRFDFQDDVFTARIGLNFKLGGGSLAPF